MIPPDPAIVAHLRSLALAALPDPPLPAGGVARREWAATLADEHAARPRAIAPLLRHLADVPDETPPATADERLWHALTRPDADPLGLVCPGEAPLIEPADTAIESWSERELSAMHAFGHHAARINSPEVWARLWSAADWHARELQPDNATNRPWASHVFLLRACNCDDADIAGAARLHAATLIHNCQVTLGRPDRLSACILLDSVMTLERLAVARSGG